MFIRGMEVGGLLFGGVLLLTHGEYWAGFSLLALAVVGAGHDISDMLT